MRRLLLLIGILTFISTCFSAEPDPSKKPALSNENSDRVTNPITNDPPPPVSLPRTLKKKPPPLSQIGEDIYGKIPGTDLIAKKDLIQQKRMADGTDSLVVSAWVQVGIGISGVVLLLATLFYTHSAASSTDRTLKIARDQLQQNRAYMMLCNGDVATITDLSKSIIQGHQVTLHWLNCGQSPAIEVKTHCTLNFITTPNPSDLPEFTEPKPEDMTQLQDIGPNQHARLGFQVTGDYADNCIEGKLFYSAGCLFDTKTFTGEGILQQ